MAKNNRVYICCGKEYSYCQNCFRDAHKPSYMTAYCGENCKIIFNTATEYNFGLKTKDEAKAIIEACDLTNLDSFNDAVQSDVKKIIEAEEPKKVEASKNINKAVKYNYVK